MSRSNPMTGRQPRSQARPRIPGTMERYRSAVEGWSLIIKELRKDQVPEVAWKSWISGGRKAIFDIVTDGGWYHLSEILAPEAIPR